MVFFFSFLYHELVQFSNNIPHDSIQQKLLSWRSIPRSRGQVYEQGAGKIDTHLRLSSISSHKCYSIKQRDRTDEVWLWKGELEDGNCKYPEIFLQGALVHDLIVMKMTTKQLWLINIVITKKKKYLFLAHKKSFWMTNSMDHARVKIQITWFASMLSRNKSSQ